jgi:hypothetical protein
MGGVAGVLITLFSWDNVRELMNFCVYQERQPRTPMVRVRMYVDLLLTCFVETLMKQDSFGCNLILALFFEVGGVIWIASKQA